MEKTIGAFEARRNFGKLIEEAFYKKDSFIVERSGRPMAVIVSIEDYQKWQRLAKEQVFSMIETTQKRNVEVSPSGLDRDVRESLKDLKRTSQASQE
ncbi:MAG: type II toxin-antitoxin system Phd/YefM family antitoxin [Anaerolineae bacterium]